MKKKLSSAALLVLLAAAYFFFGQPGEGGDTRHEPSATETTVPDSGSVSAETGARVEIPALNGTEHIVVHEAYVSSYNTKTLIPDWVAYELTRDETYGDQERGDRMFCMDPDLDTRQAKREDYYNSGWTKGHMIPASDVRWSSTGMDETFYFTNVCPQDETLNAGDWEYLERQVRKWAREYGSVYVVTGPVVGTGKYGKIGERDVTVPDAFFKAVACTTGGRRQAIAFVMGNDDQRYYLRDCAMNIDELEALTGLDLFPALDDKIENTIESRFSLSDWGIRAK